MKNAACDQYRASVNFLPLLEVVLILCLLNSKAQVLMLQTTLFRNCETFSLNCHSEEERKYPKGAFS